MERIAFAAALLLSSGSQAGELKLSLQGRGLSGKNLYVAIHTSAADFPSRDDRAIRRVVAAAGDTAELLIPNLPAGEYAVSVFADINGNGRLDRNLIGMPSEPVGISRNAKGRFGPPKFADAAFTVGDGLTTQSIRIE